jgi:hypothetical protein
VRGLQRGLRSGPRAGRQHPHRWFAATPSPKIRPASSSTAGAVPDGPHGRPRMRWPMLEPYAWEPAEQRGWNSEQGRLSSQPSLRETSAASAPEPPRVRVAGAAIENNRVCMLQERAEIAGDRKVSGAASSSMGHSPRTRRGRLARRAPTDVPSSQAGAACRWLTATGSSRRCRKAG